MNRQSSISMRKLCPNFDKENSLDTVLEVPIPEEMFTNMGTNAIVRWQNLRKLMSRAQFVGGDVKSCGSSTFHLSSGSNSEFVALLKLVGAPLIPFQVQADHAMYRPIKDGSIEASTAKYIVHQYIAATGGHGALNAVSSMYAFGQVKMIGSEMRETEEGSVHPRGDCEVGGFVLWQKNPDLWYLELVVSGFKVSAGSDGKVGWNQSSAQPSNASRGPPRPLRRFFQGLDPRSTANLFIRAVCIGEKAIDEEDCFVLKIEASPSTLRIQSSPNTELAHHKVWGYFSQRTGLLVYFEDSKLVRMKNTNNKQGNKGNNDIVFWETTMETKISDYRYVDGINIAHGGKTCVTLFRYGGSVHHKRKIEETWMIEEVDFNIFGLSLECFLPPADLKREPEINGDIVNT